MIIVSACLAGIACRYDGKSTLHPTVKRLVDTDAAVPVCPEVLGGLPVPRTPAERNGLHIYQRDGKDITQEFELGCSRALEIIKDIEQEQPVTCAILQTRSPSCGYGKIYDGIFSGKLIPGNGLFTEYLLALGIPVLTEEDNLEEEIKQYI
ncbi:MAG: DUF523 domain-containing protein [Spirochaetales bacterium]|nr:DUF523 domain-containing protein [Spirochaetales bacterium]